MARLTMRPRWGVYIFYLIFKYIFMLGFGCLFAFFIFPFSWESFILIIGDILMLIGIMFQTKEIIRYKITITESKIFLAANRDFFLTRHKDLKFTLKNLKSIQFKSGLVYLWPSAIIILNYNDRKTKYMDVLRFNYKQTLRIMKVIEECANELNRYNIEVLDEEVLGKVSKGKR